VDVSVLGGFQGCGSGKFSPDPDPIGTVPYFGYVKLYKQGKDILKIELLYIFS